MRAKSRRSIRVSAADRKKQRDERAIFRKFIHSNGVMLSVMARSIKSRLPPQPDIYCVGACHVAYRFELCELADQGMKDARGDHRLTLDRFLKPADSHRFNEKYDGCIVDVSRPANDVGRTLRTVARYLLSEKVTPPTRGDSSDSIEVPMREILGNSAIHGLVQVYLLDPFFTGKGTHWHVNSSGWFGDGVAKAIQDKSLNRSYRVRQTPSRPHLLLYYDGDPSYRESFPCQCDVNRLRPLWTPKFSDVWVFDAQKSVLVLHEVA